MKSTFFVIERLPESDEEVHNYANKEKQLKAVTENCAVKLEIQSNSGNGTRYIKLRNRNDMDRLAASAVHKFNRRPREELHNPPQINLANHS